MDDVNSILSLPDDPAILKQIITTRTRERDEANRRRDEEDQSERGDHHVVDQGPDQAKKAQDK